jgi:hypothetical protein
VTEEREDVGGLSGGLRELLGIYLLAAGNDLAKKTATRVAQVTTHPSSRKPTTMPPELLPASRHYVRPLPLHLSHYSPLSQLLLDSESGQNVPYSSPRNASYATIHGCSCMCSSGSGAFDGVCFTD